MLVKSVIDDITNSIDKLHLEPHIRTRLLSATHGITMTFVDADLQLRRARDASASTVAFKRSANVEVRKAFVKGLVERTAVLADARVHMEAAFADVLQLTNKIQDRISNLVPVAAIVATSSRTSPPAAAASGVGAAVAASSSSIAGTVAKCTEDTADVVEKAHEKLEKAIVEVRYAEAVVASKYYDNAEDEMERLKEESCIL
eukprot:GHVU01156777.1.p2 GENE.GHVU01156777.1~~GHVU01156777.1.p2  ORF type:complete len:202 (+),score=28.29 GHVU01156777.1:1416-2021(+)